MYTGYVDPYRKPTDVKISRFNVVLREKILGTAVTEETQKHEPSIKTAHEESEELLDDMFEYVPM